MPHKTLAVCFSCKENKSATFFETQTVDGGAEHVLPLRNSNGSFTVDEPDPMIYSNSKTVSLTFLSLIRSEIDALVNYASGQRHRLLFWRSK